jgi:hypothetical protein
VEVCKQEEELKKMLQALPKKMKIKVKKEEVTVGPRQDLL